MTPVPKRAKEHLSFERYVCTRCGTLCAGICSIGWRVVCADCFKTAYLTWLANTGEVTSSGVSVDKETALS